MRQRNAKPPIQSDHTKAILDWLKKLGLGLINSVIMPPIVVIPAIPVEVIVNPGYVRAIRRLQNGAPQDRANDPVVYDDLGSLQQLPASASVTDAMIQSYQGFLHRPLNPSRRYCTGASSFIASRYNAPAVMRSVPLRISAPAGTRPRPRRQACPGLRRLPVAVTSVARRRAETMVLGRRFDICSTALPGRTQHVAYAPAGSVSASSR